MRRIILVALVFAALIAAGAAQASRYVRYGVQDDAWLEYGPGTLNERLTRLQTLGLDVVRINVLWSRVEPARGQYDWSVYDPIVQGLHERGIEPLLTLVSTPSWANGGRAANWAPTSGSSFASFAAAAQRHYPFVRRWLIW
ncbi:MAG: beta-galactosidase, partial [Gaiellaceae bacterium]